MHRPLARISAAIALVSLALAGATARADVQNPFDAEQHALARRYEAQARRPSGRIPLLELWRNWDEVAPSVTRAELERLAASRRLPEPERAYVKALLARAMLRMGELERSRDQITRLGYVTAWQIAGPFDNEGKSGFDIEQPPESVRMAPFDEGARWRGRERDVGYRVYPDVSPYGYVNFDAVYRPFENVCGFAQTTVHSERDQPLSLWVGAGGAVKVYWNGEEVLRDAAYRQPDPDRQVAVVGAHAGPNRLLVKVCVTDTTWGFFLRLADARGGEARGVRVDATSMPLPEAGAARGRAPRAPRAPLAALEAAAQRSHPSADALEALARFLAYTGADDPAEHRARQLAARAAELDPSVDRLRLAASLAGERSDVVQFTHRAEERAPNDPEVRLLAAEVRMSGVDPLSALPTLEQLPAEGMIGVKAGRAHAQVLAQAELVQAALTVAEGAAERIPGSPAAERLLADAESRAGHADASIAHLERLVALRFDDIPARKRLLADAVARGALPAANVQLEALLLLGADSGHELRYIASMQEALGRTDEALDLLQRARELTPEDAENAVAMGRLLLRLGQNDAAIGALSDALALRPQDAPTRELLEQIQPQERPDERYAVDADTLLQRRRETSGFPTTTLQALTVNTVYDNGLGSSFHQLAVQVHDDEGARQLRTHSLQYDPGSQRIDVRLARVYRADGRILEAMQTFEQQLGEPWYRTYYDTRALVVVFPPLQPGDVVELRWRVDDMAHRNLFADYYGDLHFLQDFTPTSQTDYYLITPASRTFYFNEPQMPGLTRTEEVQGDRRIFHYGASDVPALRSEPGMPGMTEVAPYLHVSTYETWQEVGRWWWGLVKDQLYADDDLRRIVHDLTADAPDLETKVRRIHDWVVENTRYVALEFGIHGFKPYSVPQIVRRGFGDCKDKASLLYTMFHEAGIESHMVLVRTRRNGDIGELPASLAVFDHAITYVPGLDLYIDGTAEHSGLRELPSMDQGVMVLHVWESGAELRRTPELPPQANHRERTLAVQLRPDGSAELDVHEEVRGESAPSYRSRYQPEGTRAERFEQSLRAVFPGLHLTFQRFGPLDDLEVPVRYEYRAEVPQLAQRDGAYLRVAPSVLTDLTPGMARTPTREYALDLGGTRSYVETRTVRAPAGMRLAEVPPGGVAESPFGRLSVQASAQGDRVEVRTQLEIRRDRISPDEYPEFRQWVQQADQLLRQRISYQGGAR